MLLHLFVIVCLCWTVDPTYLKSFTYCISPLCNFILSLESLTLINLCFLGDKFTSLDLLLRASSSYYISQCHLQTSATVIHVFLCVCVRELKMSKLRLIPDAVPPPTVTSFIPTAYVNPVLQL